MEDFIELGGEDIVEKKKGIVKVLMEIRARDQGQAIATEANVVEMIPFYINTEMLHMGKLGHVRMTTHHHHRHHETGGGIKMILIANHHHTITETILERTYYGGDHNLKTSTVQDIWLMSERIEKPKKITTIGEGPDYTIVAMRLKDEHPKLQHDHRIAKQA